MEGPSIARIDLFLKLTRAISKAREQKLSLLGVNMPWRRAVAGFRSLHGSTAGSNPNSTDTFSDIAISIPPSEIL